jgi:FixJ family two-component response regulator
MASDNPATAPAVHIIDDDQALRDSLAFLLRAAQLEVRSFDSAKTFLDAAGCVPRLRHNRYKNAGYEWH